MCEIVSYWKRCGIRPGRIWGSKIILNPPPKKADCKCDGPYPLRNPSAWTWGNNAGWYEARPDCPLHGRVGVVVSF